MKIFPLFIPHLGCPFRCVFCNQQEITKTKLPHFSDFENELAAFCHKHSSLKKEIAFFGGTFTSIPENIQESYLNFCSRILDKNTAIRISTRPDAIDYDILNFLSNYGVKTIELGIQSFDDKVLLASKRGYNADTAIASCHKIKKAGFNLGIQLMPGLPGETSSTINVNLSNVINIQPDFVRIYPTVVIHKTELAHWYKIGKFKPLSLQEAIFITASMKRSLDSVSINIIKMGLHADMDSNAILAGPYHPTFGELVRAEILKQDIIANFKQNCTLSISYQDISLFKGFNGKMLVELKNQLGITKLPIVVDSKLLKNNFNFKKIKENEQW